MILLKIETPTHDGINPLRKNYIFKMTLADSLRATMFGTMDGFADNILHLPLHMPGHTSIWWMGILVVGKGVIGKFGSGIVMGIVSGLLAVFLGMGNTGVFEFLKYFIPGLLIDLLAPFYRYKLGNPFVGAICGALASLSKLAASIAVGLLVNTPLLFLTLGLGYVAFCHVIYGAIGGILAAIIIRQLKPRLGS